MKRVAVTTGFVLLLVCTTSHAQSTAVTPGADPAPASQTSCVILKRIGRIGRTESRLTHFGINGKQFRFVEGKLPDGFSFREKMNENNVRNLESRGTQVLVLDSHYTADDLKEARADCQRGSGKAASQVEAKASLTPAPSPVASMTAPTAKPAAKPAPATESIVGTSAPAGKPPSSNATSLDKAPSANASTRDMAPSVKTSTSKTDDSAPFKGATEAALVDVSSTPSGADVYIDESFFGRTPATTIILMPGNHKIAVKKSGFVVWQKKMNLPSGPTNVNAELLPK